MEPRILLTAPGSGSGKTTIAIALMKALEMKGLKVSAYKCGPDYIDPMYHKKTLDIPAYNLDPFFLGEKELCESIKKGLKDRDIAVIEGVMGYYDGYGEEGKASTWEVAYKTNTPAILVINAKGMSNSIGAVIKGFISYKENHQIKGVIFNNISKGMYSVLSKVARKENVIPLGYMPNNPEITIESRHLGLKTADELNDVCIKINLLGKMALENLDIDGIIAIANESPDIESIEHKEKKHVCKEKLKVAVAKDEAFCFIYQENLDMLTEYGCEIEYFSPLHDEKIPEDCKGLYLPGGYPELYLDELSQNLTMLSSVKKAIDKKKPTIAECGGFMYLHEMIDGKKMAGIIPGTASKKDRLVRFGYGTMTAKENGLILKANESIRIHEFHYYDSENNGNAMDVIKASNGTKYECAFSTETLYAGYPHMFFRANENVVKNFVDAMKNS